MCQKFTRENKIKGIQKEVETMTTVVSSVPAEAVHVPGMDLKNVQFGSACFDDKENYDPEAHILVTKRGDDSVQSERQRYEKKNRKGRKPLSDITAQVQAMMQTETNVLASACGDNEQMMKKKTKSMVGYRSSKVTQIEQRRRTALKSYR